MKKNIGILALLVCLFFNSKVMGQSEFPTEWWQEVSREGVPSWEILPQDAKPGVVILSKRTELGVFSNLAPTSFVYEGVRYASIEALWQMMKYPDGNDPSDIRLKWKEEYPYSRQEVTQMSGFAAKEAGDLANQVN